MNEYLVVSSNPTCADKIHGYYESVEHAEKFIRELAEIDPSDFFVFAAVRQYSRKWTWAQSNIPSNPIPQTCEER